MEVAHISKLKYFSSGVSIYKHDKRVGYCFFKIAIFCIFFSLQITSLTTLQARLATIESRLTIITMSLKSEFKLVTGAEATSLQISAGFSTVTSTSEASSTFLLVLQSVTVNMEAMMGVLSTLDTLVSDGAHTHDHGHHAKGSHFLKRLQQFFLVIEEDISSPAIAALSFGITQMQQLTFTEEEITELKSFQENTARVMVRMKLSLAFFNSQFKVLTGADASEKQILAGDASASVANVAKQSEFNLKVLTENANIAAKNSMLCGAIARDAVQATSSGSVEMTAMELNTLVMKLFTLINKDFLFVTGISALMVQIESAKLTTALTEQEGEMVNRIVLKLDHLVMDIGVSIQVIHMQHFVLTGIPAFVAPTGEKKTINLLLQMREHTVAYQVCGC